MEERAKLLHILRSSYSIRRKHQLTRRGTVRPPHSREVGAGFIAEDIESIHLIPEVVIERPSGRRVVLKPREIEVKTPAFTLRQPVGDYNLREIEEMIKFLEG